MTTSLSALLFAALSQLSPVANWLVETGEQMVIVEPVDLGEPVAIVQVDVLGEPEEAKRLATNIELRLGTAVEVFIEEVPSDVDDLPPSFGVNVGPFDSFESAELALAQLRAAGFDGFVRELDPMLGC